MTRRAGLAATYRPPARIASPRCSRGSTLAACVFRQAATTAITARNVAALTRNTVPALLAARIAPPMAGPIERARFWFTEPSEIACCRSGGATSSGCRVCQVGEVSACPMPRAKIRASSVHGRTSPASASAPRATAAASMSPSEISRKWRRLTRSPSAPAATANSTTGRLPAVDTSAT